MLGEVTDEDARYETIRMFPDYAHTVLWFVDPVPYRRTCLTAALVRELERWEKSYYDSLTQDLQWVSAAAARAFTEEGVRLAHRISAEVGSRFIVEFRSYEPGADTVWIRAGAPAQNASAEAAFARLSEELIAEERRTAELFGNGDGEWTAYAPLSGTVFTPDARDSARGSEL